MPTVIPIAGEIHDLDIRDLTDHPLLSSIPIWDRTSAEFVALVESIRDRGLDYELLVDVELRIIDGRNRRNALATLGRPARCRIVEKEDATSIVVASLINRRHLTKGALAYLAAPMFDAVISESKARRLRNLRDNDPARSPSAIDPALNAGSAKNAGELATQIGVGLRLFEQAMQLHRLFTKAGAKARAKYECRVLGP